MSGCNDQHGLLRMATLAAFVLSSAVIVVAPGAP